MPGYVEGTGDTIMTKLDLVSGLVKVISLMLKTGKKIMNTCIHL